MLLVTMLSACGSSVITLSDKSSNYSIYLDKVKMGSKEVRIQRSGGRQTKIVEVKDASGRVVAHEKIKRELNLLKAIGGFTPYTFPLLFFRYEYDKEIEIFIAPSQQKNPNDSTYKSKWD